VQQEEQRPRGRHDETAPSDDPAYTPRAEPLPREEEKLACPARFLKKLPEVTIHLQF